jgi:hypothetical protein
MTSTDEPNTEYDWRLEILDDGHWRTWARDWKHAGVGNPDAFARQTADQHCEHLNVDWRIHIWPGTGTYIHADQPIAVLTGQPKPVNERRRDEPRTCDALCRDIEQDRDRLAAQVEQLTRQLAEQAGQRAGAQ